jgi:hypothetical protein
MSLKFSQDIQVLLKKLATKPVAIAEILQETAERGFSLIIGLLVLPFLFPMPPGLSSILGLGCLILGSQMALGRKHPWLPRKVAQFKFPRSLSQQLLKNVRRLLIWLEKIMRSRWQHLANNSYTWRGNGFCIAWLSILLMLPIPFTNPLPAIAILLLAVATIEADGLIMCLGYFLTLANTIFFIFIGYALWQAPHLLPNLFK